MASDLHSIQEVAKATAAAWARTPWAQWLGEPREDLEQEAFIGAWRAHRSYDPRQGAYYNWLRIGAASEIRHHLRDLNLVRLPRWMYEGRPKVWMARDRWWMQHGRRPSPEEIAAAVHMPSARVRQILSTERAGLVMSLEPLIEEQEADMLVSDSNLPDSMDDRALVLDALARLPARERTLVLLYYGYSWRQHELARSFGMSQKHVSRLVRRAVLRLRKMLDPRASLEGFAPTH